MGVRPQWPGCVGAGPPGPRWRMPGCCSIPQRHGASWSLLTPEETWGNALAHLPLPFLGGWPPHCLYTSSADPAGSQTTSRWEPVRNADSRPYLTPTKSESLTRSQELLRRAVLPTTCRGTSHMPSTHWALQPSHCQSPPKAEALRQYGRPTPPPDVLGHVAACGQYFPWMV